MISLNYTSLALWLGMGPAFPECGQKRSWVPKQNQDSVRRKEEENDCRVGNYDCDSPFSKWNRWPVSILQYFSPVISNATYLDLKSQTSQTRIIYYTHKKSPRGQLNSLFEVCSNSSPVLITPLLHGLVQWVLVRANHGRDHGLNPHN